MTQSVAENGAGERGIGFQPASTTDRLRFWGPGFLLALAILAVYGQTAWYGFLSYDDGVYVSENPFITPGVTWAGLKEVILHGHNLLWTPLTSLSYMLDCNLYGLNATGHHMTSVVLHIVATFMVFYALWRYTGAYWLAWFIAGLFALHPLNVESVAWISGRKNQLYAICWMGSLLAYQRYTLAPSLRRYFAVFLLHFAGLAAKPTHLMLPAVLLLLDLWPLGRLEVKDLLNTAGIRRAAWLVAEKLPLFALSAAISVLTFRIVDVGGGMRSLDAVPLSMRLPNTAYVYAFFVEKLFWPTKLSVEYPYPAPALPGLVVGLSVGLMAVLAAIVLVSLFRKKASCVGIGWYAVILLPESGLLRANAFLMADRYAYVSTLGLMIAFLWPVGAFIARRPKLRPAAIGLAVAVLVVLAGVSFVQCKVWASDLTLFTQSVAVNPDGASSHNGLGGALKVVGRTDEALAEFEKSIASPGPFKVLAMMNLGTFYYERGDYAKAATYFEEEIIHNPAYIPGLVWALHTRQKLGDNAGAELLIDRAAVVSPNEPNVVEALKGRAPDRARGYTDWGSAMVRIDRSADGIKILDQALAIEPERPEALLAAWSAAMNLGDAQRAEGYIQRYLKVQPDKAMAWGAHGMSLEALGKRDDARAAAQHALSLDPQQPQGLELMGRLK